MSTVPRLSGRDCIQALARAGWGWTSTKGSHAKLSKAGCRSIIVPLHDELDRGTLRAIIRQSGLSVEQFVELL
ncbi:MAG TPA: type II toxin-antitoxin system HicA family toxin [Thermoplasmata archaeon]|nr:type II toxin-antitoxin system HicA family toxin [Thermoplasmata archaeon]